MRRVTEMVDPAVVELLHRTYAAFNARRVEDVLATLSPRVDWPDMVEHARIHGHDQVREYWLRQFAQVDPRVEPGSMAVGPDGRVVVNVRQVVRTLDGDLLADRLVQHVYTIDGGLVERMDVREL